MIQLPPAASIPKIRSSPQIFAFQRILAPLQPVRILRREVATFRRKIEVFGVVVDSAGQSKARLG
jgi:hypothetical protein